jgi:hypothetical protein
VVDDLFFGGKIDLVHNYNKRRGEHGVSDTNPIPFYLLALSAYHFDLADKNQLGGRDLRQASQFAPSLLRFFMTFIYR